MINQKTSHIIDGNKTQIRDAVVVNASRFYIIKTFHLQEPINLIATLLIVFLIKK